MFEYFITLDVHCLNFKRLYRYMILEDIPKKPSTPELRRFPKIWIGSSFSLRHIRRSLNVRNKFSQQSCLSLLIIIKFSLSSLTVMVSSAATLRSLSSVYVFLRVLMQQVRQVIIPPSHHALETLLKKLDHISITLF